MKEQAEERNCLSIRAVTEPTCHGFKPFDIWREHNKTCAYFGYFIRVNANDWHGATVGNMGGSFLSVQHWKNGTNPSSVHWDWEYKDKTETTRTKRLVNS